MATPSPQEQSESFGCRIIAEFEDDAQNLGNAAAIAPITNLPVSTTPGSPLRFSKRVLSSAKKFWWPIIQRFTEPVPGRIGEYRVRGVTKTDDGVICIACHRGSSSDHLSRGQKVDTSDPKCIFLFEESEENWAERGRVLSSSVIGIPWVDILTITFRTRRSL
jgi:hypothetical protein